MTLMRAIAVLAVGFVAGAMTAVVGAGSLASFPVLLAIGLSPVVANVTSAVGVLPGSIAGAYAYRHQLGPLRRLVLPLLLPTAAGGIGGALLLLALPSAVFSSLLPVLLVVAAGLVAFQPAIARAVLRRRGIDEPPRTGAAHAGHQAGPVVLVLGVAIALYGGYFGAAVSVLYLALLGALIGGLQASNGVKNVLDRAQLRVGLRRLRAARGRGLGAGRAARGGQHGGGRARRPVRSATARRAAAGGDRRRRADDSCGRGVQLS